MMTHEEYESLAALDAIGAATAEEERILRAHLESCASCRLARDEFGEATALLAEGLDPVAPPAEVRGRVIAAIDPGESHGETLSFRRRRFPWWLATAATLFLALWGWREIGMRVMREKVREQDRLIAQLREARQRAEEQKEKLAATIASIAAKEGQTIALAGTEVAPSASARLFLDPAQRRAVVFFSNLPANPAGRSYQLWIIRADQPKPQSAGVFDVPPNGSAILTIENLPVATEIKALAVTLEPKGGVEQPTNTRFYVAGKT